MRKHEIMKFKERSKEEKVQRIDHLTGLRFFAALLVFLSHVNFSGEYAPLHLVFKQGYIGVSFFFILSGFVLSYSYKSRILEKSISKTKYLILRYVRIYPLHWLVSLPVILSSIGDKFLTPSITLANLSLFQSWMPASMFYFSLNAPSWSLSNEMFFYFCFMGLVFLSPNAIRVLTLSLGLIILFAAVVANHYFPQYILLLRSNFVRWMFYIFPLFRLLEFLIGMWIFNLWKEKKFAKSNTATFSMILLFISMYFVGQAPESFRYSILFVPFIVFFFVSNLSDKKSLMLKFFASKPLILLGEASFAFYLIHQKLIMLFRTYYPEYIGHQMIFAISSLVVISLLSIVIHLYIEKPVEKFLKKLVNSKIAI